MTKPVGGQLTEIAVRPVTAVSTNRNQKTLPDTKCILADTNTEGTKSTQPVSGSEEYRTLQANAENAVPKSKELARVHRPSTFSTSDQSSAGALTLTRLRGNGQTELPSRVYNDVELVNMQ
jgi:hypothetical protein